MPDASAPAPRSIPQVMVSSTFTDLVEHRAVLIAAINGHGLHPRVMEHDSARLVDVIESSLQMVQVSAAYIGVISMKYGQTPEDKVRNPDKLSITELEFNEAQRLGRPVLLFVMGDQHQGTKDDFEKDPEKEKKLNAFRERAKKIAPGSSVNRVYAVFNSLEDFKDKLGSSLNELCQFLVSKDSPPPTTPLPTGSPSTLPKPPAFYAEPDYIGSHQFVGRKAELDALSDWANRSDPTNLLLFEAIGGNGKSMLTWEWTTKHATTVRSDWAGRFWYSFYERGAIMQDFCQRALAYMTGRPLKEFEKRKTTELKDELIAQLHARPWLLILDGLERVLVAYHRIDAAEVPDEEANAPTDKILNRNPCDAIRDEDSDLLRALAACAPSKILVSSRLTPRILLNQAGQLIPGAKRITLPGLCPPDAEALLRQCGISGDSAAIQDYLQQNCDNHPLVIGILAGLIANYLPDRGNFDAWSIDPSGGAALDLGQLNLIQRRNHILLAAFSALPDASRQLISTLALLSESVDYKTLQAFNPHLPLEPKKVSKPSPLEESQLWKMLTGEVKSEMRKRHQASIKRWMEYERASETRRKAPAYREGCQRLEETALDLERRGLFQYDKRTRRYDLHPVVRSVATTGIRSKDKQLWGQRVIDHFVSQRHVPYQEAHTLADVEPGLGAVRALLKLGRYQEASALYQEGLADALHFNLEAHVETLSLIAVFFSSGWAAPPINVPDSHAGKLGNHAASALLGYGEVALAFAAFGSALRTDLERADWFQSNIWLRNISRSLGGQNMLAKAYRVNQYALALAEILDAAESLFVSHLRQFVFQTLFGQHENADNSWQCLDPMGRNWSRAAYRRGTAEVHFASAQHSRGNLKEEHLAKALGLAEADNNRVAIRSILDLRGVWRLEQQDWQQAMANFQESVRMARERRLVDSESETGLVLAKFHLGQFTDENARNEAERLTQLHDPDHRTLAMLWLAIGDPEQAKHHALAAYRWAWADGEPYVNRYELTKTTELLQQMNVPVPVLPPYDESKDEPFPWEADVRAAIEKLKAEKTKPAPLA